MDYRTERSFHNVYVMIDDICDSLQLGERVGRKAKHLYRCYRTKRGRIKKVRILASVLVHLAARTLHVGRTLKEFGEKTGQITVGELGEYTKIMSRELHLSTFGATNTQMLRRYASELGLARQVVVRRGLPIHAKIMKSNILGGRNPHSIISVVLFLLVRLYLPKMEMSLKKICNHLQISLNTSQHCLQRVVKELSSSWDDLPTWENVLYKRSKK